MRHIVVILTLLLLPLSNSFAQHTIGVTAGGSVGFFRPYPSQTTQTVKDLYTAGVSWRYYTSQRYVGSFGVDLEFLQRGYSFAPFASATTMEDVDYYYTRRYNSLMLPFVWQPHVYMFHNRVRVFMDAAVTFTYNMSSTYVNDAYKYYYGSEDWQGDYEYKTARDNRFGYGLMGGFGISYIFGRCEVMARGRYYFGYSDILRNRNKYYGNSNDGAENPFYYTPTRSPVDNISICVGFSYRLGKGDGFDSWRVKITEKVERSVGFNYSGKK